jgi:hypothetical protein
MGKLLLLIVMPVALGTSTLLLSSSRDALGSADSTLNSRSDEVVARELALSGVAEAESALLPVIARSPAYTGARTFTASISGGTYSATIATAGATHTITSTGTMNGHSVAVGRVYRAEFVPDFMGNAVFTDNNLLLNSPLTIRAESPDLNGNVRTNHNFQINGGPTAVNGFALHAGQLNLNTGVPAPQIFTPPVNPTNAPVTQAVAPITIPALVPANYAGFANRQTLGDLTLSGNVVLGTRENPTIWYVAGALQTSANVTLSGYGVFLVRDEVRFSHHVWTQAMDESNAAFYSGGHIKVINGSLDIAGQLFANGNVELKEYTNLTGSLVARNTLNTLGPVTIIYRHPAQALTERFWPQVVGGSIHASAVPTGVVMSSYREW